MISLKYIRIIIQHMQKNMQRIGEYKVRKIAKGEQIIHAPATSAGTFVLYVEPNGTLTYVPLVEVKS